MLHLFHFLAVNATEIADWSIVWVGILTQVSQTEKTTKTPFGDLFGSGFVEMSRIVVPRSIAGRFRMETTHGNSKKDFGKDSESFLRNRRHSFQSGKTLPESKRFEIRHKLRPIRSSASKQSASFFRFVMDERRRRFGTFERRMYREIEVS